MKISGMVIDMDGVLYRGETFLPGVEAFFAYMRDRNVPFVLATNNATKGFSSVEEKFGTLDIRISPDEFLGSANAAALYVKENFSATSQIYVVGEYELRSSLKGQGLLITNDPAEAELVVVGLDREANWTSLTAALSAINHGAAFIGTNPDPSLPIENGLGIGTGALLAALTAASGQQPLIIGKPQPTLYEIAIRRMGISAQETLAVGDRLDTDIAGAASLGMPSALLLTGVTTRDHLEVSAITPDFVFRDLNELVEALPLGA